MAPIKMEENFKERLDKRRITPSENAWEKLSLKLDESDKSGNKKYFRWIGIAASIIGVLLISNIVFNTNQNDKTLPVIVDSPSDIQIDSPQFNSEKITESNPEPLLDIDREPVLQSKNTAIAKKSIPQEVAEVAGSPKNTLNESEKTNQLKNSFDLEIIEKTGQNKPIEDALLAENVVNDEVEVTDLDSEINSLLADAQKKINSEKNKLSNNKFVDANLLLEGIENDLEESFRDKVFNSIVTGYNTIRVAIADRNE